MDDTDHNVLGPLLLLTNRETVLQLALRELFSHLKTSLCQILSSLCQDDTHPASIVETDREGRLQNRQRALCHLRIGENEVVKT